MDRRNLNILQNVSYCEKLLGTSDIVAFHFTRDKNDVVVILIENDVTVGEMFLSRTCLYLVKF